MKITAWFTAAMMTVTVGMTSMANAAGYRVPGFVQALSTGQTSAMLTNDQEKNAMVLSYVLGFAFNLEKSCGFLSPQQNAALTKTLEVVHNTRERNPNFWSAAQVGYADSETFVQQNGCTSQASQTVMRSVTPIIDA